jgi:predicted acetyltransferase
MTRLAEPDVRLSASWGAAVREFQDAGERHIHGAGLWNVPDEVWMPADGQACAAVVAELTARNDTTVPVSDGHVPGALLWIVDGDPEELVGFVSIRFELNDFLLEEGGHVGYSVRPSRRRQGYAGRALRLSLEALRERGVTRVLVTCDDDNAGSARTIENAGGVLEDVRHDKRRYWIDAGHP